MDVSILNYRVKRTTYSQQNTKVKLFVLKLVFSENFAGFFYTPVMYITLINLKMIDLTRCVPIELKNHFSH